MAATFNISVVSIIPYAFFNIVAAVLCLIYGYTGFTMTKYSKEELNQIQIKDEAVISEI